MLFFGNLIDNHNQQHHHLKLIILLEVIFAIVCVYQGINWVIWFQGIDGKHSGN